MGQKVMILRQFDEPLTEEEVRALMAKSSWCWEAHQAQHLESFLSADGMSTLCVYDAPDAESVRIANAQADLPAARIWAATEHGSGSSGDPE